METPENNSNKYDINYRINQAYNIYYTKGEKCLRPRSVIIGEILGNLNIVKFDRKIEELDTVINNLLDAKFEYISKSKNCCSFVRINDNAPKSRLDIYFYKNRQDVDNINSSINVHSISKHLLFTNQSINKRLISIPILNIDVDLSNKKVSSFLDKHSECSDFLKKIKKGDLGNILSFQVSEYFFNTSSLKDTISNLPMEPTLSKS